MEFAPTKKNVIFRGMDSHELQYFRKFQIFEISVACHRLRGLLQLSCFATARRETKTGPSHNKVELIDPGGFRN